MTQPAKSNYARRDRLVGALANAVLRLASKHYRAMIAGAIQYGMSSAARDSRYRSSRPLEPWEVLAKAVSVAEIACECTGYHGGYLGRDGRWHCGGCDGVTAHPDEAAHA